MSIETAYNILYMGSLIIFAILIGVMLVRSVIGPRITDRILSVNMIGTMIICCIVILSRYLDEGYLVDVALIYAMISFVSVLIYASTYIPAKPGRRPLNGRKKARRKGDRRNDPMTHMKSRRSPARCLPAEGRRKRCGRGRHGGGRPAGCRRRL